mmetsp:Transcript_8588/g.13284  ORF Transcript_8588/g.13284 Transcript_8588/m.13284 type:complete len:97 (-) Transcript_8588:989-1279(-)
MSLIEHFETSKGFSFQLDTTQNETHLSSLKKQLDLNLSDLDLKLDSLSSERTKIVKQIIVGLTNAGIEGLEEAEGSIDVLLSKLEILLQNYLEDQR